MSRTKRSLRSAAWLAAATMALIALLAPAVANAWTSPAITALCAPDATHYEFTVALSQEANENFDWSFGSSGPWTTVAGHVGANDLVVVRGSGDLWVRWTSDQGLMAHTTPNGTLCATPTPAATPTPTATPVQSESLPPTASPSGTVAPTSSATATPTATPPVASEVIPTPMATPSGVVLGATGVPTITPPPTDTVAASSSNNDSWRLLLLGMAIVLALGLVAAPASRRR